VPLKDRPPKRGRENIIKVEVYLSEHANVPSALPVRRISASRSNCTFCPTQITPGLIVPVVGRRAKLLFAGVTNVASTSGIRWFTKSGRSRSTTFVLR
jgi:hypothetical protein